MAKRKVWVLDSETKGTGAQMVPLEDVEQKPAPRSPRPRPHPAAEAPPRPRKRKKQPERTASALPPGHVRKKTTGELGKVKAVDPRAGTVTVHWLKHGQTSTVPLSSVSRS
jgi:hypothetical protein